MVLVVTIAIVLIIVIVIVVICCIRKKKNEAGSRQNFGRSEIDYNPAAKRNTSDYYLSPRE